MLIYTTIATLDGGSELHLLHQYEEQVSDLKKELSDVRNELLTLGLEESDDLNVSLLKKPSLTALSRSRNDSLPPLVARFPQLLQTARASDYRSWTCPPSMEIFLIGAPSGNNSTSQFTTAQIFQIRRFGKARLSPVLAKEWLCKERN